MERGRRRKGSRETRELERIPLLPFIGHRILNIVSHLDSQLSHPSNEYSNIFLPGERIPHGAVNTSKNALG